MGWSYNTLYMCFAQCTLEASEWHGLGLSMFYNEDEKSFRGSGSLQFENERKIRAGFSARAHPGHSSQMTCSQRVL